MTTENKSDTPETDSEIEDARNVVLDFDCRTPRPKEGENIYVVPADFARRLERERDELKRGSTENCFEWQDWERWAKEVCEDFRIPFDNHKVGMRMSITQWMADSLNKNSRLEQERDEARRIQKSTEEIWHGAEAELTKTRDELDDLKSRLQDHEK